MRIERISLYHFQDFDYNIKGAFKKLNETALFWFYNLEKFWVDENN